MFSKIINKLAIIILIAIAVFLTVFVLSPQCSFAPYFTGEKIRRWFFIVLVAALYIVLTFCTVDRIWRQVRSKYNSPSWWGSIIFHASFYVIVTGACISIGGRKTGLELFTESETVIFSENNYLLHDRPPFAVKLNRFLPVFENDMPVDYACDFSVYYDTAEGWMQARKSGLKVNMPLEEQGVSLVFKRWGYSPRIIIRDNEYNEIIGMFNLNLGEKIENGNPQKFFTDFTSVPNTNLKLELKFYPEMENGKHVPAYTARNPRIYAKLYSGKRVYVDGYIAMKESLVSDTLTLTFDDFNYWVGVEVVNDIGENIVFAGFVIAVIGLAFRMLF
ncbi:MAG: cytochrome c biogenesis protein ResB [Planctomycetes bacterium]|nr:cytochrome c biogenesis protein ResB [Planctomycetota bacterium]